MTTRKREDYLDAGISDEEDGSQGYDSDAEVLNKGGRSTKRQKVDVHESDDESEDDLESNGSDEEEKGGEPETKDKAPVKDSSKKPPSISKLADLPGVSKPLTKKNLIKTAEAIKRSGVVYLSRIPPFMKPQKLRSLLEPYGAINRIFLSPEDPKYRKSRLKQGGNKKRTFGDGWVEFVNKADAKRACELLNTRTIGGKKSSFYHDDVWNLLYLKNFKWDNLTQQVANENAERSSRERAELSRTKKENKEFVQNVERAKMLEGMEAKKALKKRNEVEDSQNHSSEVPVKEVKRNGERPRQFKQTATIKKGQTGDQSDQVKRVLSKIF